MLYLPMAIHCGSMSTTWWLRASSALWASLLVVLFLFVGIAMSWRKAALEVDWVGWCISPSAWIVAKMLNQTKIAFCERNEKVLLKNVRPLVSRLPWVTSAWHCLRPLLIHLYKAMRKVATSMVGMEQTTFQICIVAWITTAFF